MEPVPDKGSATKQHPSTMRVRRSMENGLQTSSKNMDSNSTDDISSASNHSNDSLFHRSQMYSRCKMTNTK